MAGELAIVMSGGGAKGAFQVGVLDELITTKKVRIDIFCGVSTGAIQALGGAMNDMPGLLAQWLSIKGNGDIYKKRTLGVVEGIFGADSLYDAAPIRAKLKAYADPAKLKAAKRKLRMGVVSLATGQYQEIDEKNPNVGDWVYASCAQPPFFQPLVTKDAAGVNEQWVDGGVRNITPLSSALELKPRATLVILASPASPVPAPGKIYGNMIDIALRSVGILTSEVARTDLDNAMLVNDLLAAREAQLRRLLAAGLPAAAAADALLPLDTLLASYSFSPVRLMAPDPGFAAADTLEFSPAKIRAAIEAGRKAFNDEWSSLKLFLGV